MGVLLIFTDKTVTMLKIKALVPCYIHAILPGAFLTKMQWIVDYEHRLIGFLPGSCSEDKVETEGSGNDDDISVHNLLLLRPGLWKRCVHVTEDSERRDN